MLSACNSCLFEVSFLWQENNNNETDKSRNRCNFLFIVCDIFYLLRIFLLTIQILLNKKFLSARYTVLCKQRVFYSYRCFFLNQQILRLNLSVKIPIYFLLAKFIMRTGLLLCLLFLLNCFQLSNQKKMLRTIVADKPPRPKIIVIDRSHDSIPCVNNDAAGRINNVPFFINNKQNLTWKIDL